MLTFWRGWHASFVGGFDGAELRRDADSECCTWEAKKIDRAQRDNPPRSFIRAAAIKKVFDVRR